MNAFSYVKRNDNFFAAYLKGGGKCSKPVVRRTENTDNRYAQSALRSLERRMLSGHQNDG